MKPASVICEILNEDGTMSRLPDLERFATTHGLKICTVADLIQYRLRCDSLVHRVAEATIPSRYGGDFRLCVYTTDVDAGEHVALVKGTVDPEKPTLVRAHAEFLPGDVFHMAERDTAALLHEAMRKIGDDGCGVIVYLRRDGRSAEIGDTAKGGETPTPSTDPATRERDFREYGIGAQILRDLGVRKIRLLTNSTRNLVSLPGYGLEIVECVPLAVPASKPHRGAAAKPRKRPAARAGRV